MIHDAAGIVEFLEHAATLGFAVHLNTSLREADGAAEGVAVWTCRITSTKGVSPFKVHVRECGSSIASAVDMASRVFDRQMRERFHGNG
jgi:hypothetical protein